MLGLLAVLPMPLQAADLDLRYRLQWGNLALGTIAASWQLRPDSYQMQGSAQSAGAVGWLMRYQGEVRLQGRLEGDEAYPENLFLSSDSRRGARQARTEWDSAGQPSTARLPELDLDEVVPLDETRLGGTSDPFSVMVQLLKKMQAGMACAGQFDLYDGWRHSQIQLYDLGSGQLAADRPWAYSGKVRICGLSSRPIGGQRRDSKWSEDDLDPQRIRFFIADTGAGLPLPVRIELRGFLGQVIVRLDMAGSGY